MIKLPDFIIVPYQLLEDRRITLVDERLYGIIYWFTKLKNESCTASNKTLAELVKSTNGTIQNSLTKLEELGYIQRIFKDTQKKTRKEIIALVVFAKVSPTSDTQQKVSPTDDMVSPTSDTGYHPQVNRIRIYNKNNKEDNTSEPSSQVSLLIDLFKEVNPSYKKFFSNKTQRSACSRLLENHGLEKLTKIISFLPKSNVTQYMPVVTTPLQLEDKFGQLASAWQKIKNNEPIIL